MKKKDSKNAPEHNSFVCFVYPSLNQSLKYDLLITYSGSASACYSKGVAYKGIGQALLSVRIFLHL